MALTTLFCDDSSDRTFSPNVITVAFARAARAVAGWRAERARELALHDLLDMEPQRLRDPGISIHDIHDALAQRRDGRR